MLAMDTERRQGDRRTSDRGTRDRRCGRPPYVPISLDELRLIDGPPIRPRDLAFWSGFSEDKILSLLRDGYLAGKRTPDVPNGQWTVHRAAARTFLRDLGVLAFE